MKYSIDAEQDPQILATNEFLDFFEQKDSLKKYKSAFEAFFRNFHCDKNDINTIYSFLWAMKDCLEKRNASINQQEEQKLRTIYQPYLNIFNLYSLSWTTEVTQDGVLPCEYPFNRYVVDIIKDKSIVIKTSLIDLFYAITEISVESAESNTKELLENYEKFIQSEKEYIVSLDIQDKIARSFQLMEQSVNLRYLISSITSMTNENEMGKEHQTAFLNLIKELISIKNKDRNQNIHYTFLLLEQILQKIHEEAKRKKKDEDKEIIINSFSFKNIIAFFNHDLAKNLSFEIQETIFNFFLALAMTNYNQLIEKISSFPDTNLEIKTLLTGVINEINRENDTKQKIDHLIDWMREAERLLYLAEHKNFPRINQSNSAGKNSFNQPSINSNNEISSEILEEEEEEKDNTLEQYKKQIDTTYHPKFINYRDKINALSKKTFSSRCLKKFDDLSVITVSLTFFEAHPSLKTPINKIYDFLNQFADHFLDDSNNEEAISEQIFESIKKEFLKIYKHHDTLDKIKDICFSLFVEFSFQKTIKEINDHQKIHQSVKDLFNLLDSLYKRVDENRKINAQLIYLIEEANRFLYLAKNNIQLKVTTPKLDASQSIESQIALLEEVFENVSSDDNSNESIYPKEFRIFDSAVCRLQSKAPDICQLEMKYWGDMRNFLQLKLHQNPTSDEKNDIKNVCQVLEPTPSFKSDTKRIIETSNCLKNECYSKLYGNKFPDLRTKIIIFGLLGMLAGFVIGAAIGALITAWGGGIGAFPGAFIGLFIGMKLGIAIGMGIALPTFVASLELGNLYEKIERNNFAEKQDNYKGVLLKGLFPKNNPELKKIAKHKCNPCAFCA